MKHIRGARGGCKSRYTHTTYMHTYMQTDRQTDRQTYTHTSIRVLDVTARWARMMTKHVVETSLCSRMVNEPDPAPPDPFSHTSWIPDSWILSPGIRLGVGEGGRGRPDPVSHTSWILDSWILSPGSGLLGVGEGIRGLYPS